MIVLIDNYDSFTYNLVQRIGEMDHAAELRVFRHDKITVDQVAQMSPSHVIISPGPGTPLESGISNDLIQRLAGQLPILGVCLGHQCIGHVFGMTVERNYRLMHGKTSWIHHDGKTIFRNLPNPMLATRYHSLIITRQSFDEQRFQITAWTDEGEIMGLRGIDPALGPAPLEGVQFHPESFLSDHGPDLLANFLGLSAPAHAAHPNA